MTSNRSTPPAESLPEPAPQEPVCEQCGRYGAQPWGDRLLCSDCVTLCGSCCPEFGAWDAWTPTEQADPPSTSKP